MESDNMSELKKVKLSEIDDFNNHPFKVIKDNSFYELVDSIKENGLLTPLIVRRKESGKYELISGHRRKLALEVLGILESEVEIRDLDNDEAIILMVDSNLYRNNILPSEKAFAYKMKLEAIKHQGKKKPLLHNLCQSYLHPG
jgi:ParB family chromosome partitioning protein